MFKSFLFLFLNTFSIICFSQNKSNSYGLTILNTIKELDSTIKLNKDKSFVNLKDYIPNIFLDIKYATTQNVFYEKLYPNSYALLRLPAANALKAVQLELQKYGVGLKIYDAYRPYRITCRMFEIIPDTIYMGLPWKGSKHNRGISVDVTLIDLATRKELLMPTPFDALVYASHPDFKGLPENVLNNRKLLISTMTKFGFKVDPVEWWHFNYIGNSEFDLLDLPHEEIEKYISNK